MNPTHIALLRLRALPKLGIIQVRKLINIFGSPTAIFQQSEQSLAMALGNHYTLAKELLAPKNETLAIKEYEKNIAAGIEIIDESQESYPEKLKHCQDAPLLLFKDANSSVNFERSISIVGTRKMTPYGAKVCKEIIAGFAKYKPTIVSGFAYGVDITAHIAALENHFPTIGVLAHGFGTLYPKAHKKYYASVKNAGGFITEHCFDELPLPANFLRRNRIIAGLTSATLVIESPFKGGALSTARLASGYNREVFAVPGAIDAPQSEGCNLLIKNDIAMLVSSAKDIATALGWEDEKNTTSLASQQKQITLPLSMSEEEKQVMDLLSTSEKTHIDVLANELNMPVHQVVNLLFQLEMKDLVKPLSGKFYQRR